jgi:hypothetical protein
MTVHGKRALDRLVGCAANLEIIDDIFAGVLLQCFAFLDLVLPQDDYRRQRIEQRRESCEKLRVAHGYLWGPGSNQLAS